MKKNKMIIVAAAALAFFGMSTSAFAAWTIGVPTSVVANELNAAAKAAVAPAVPLSAVAGANYTLTIALPGPVVAGGATTNVTVSLTNGAVFSVVPTMGFTAASTGTFAAGPAFVAGSTSYTFGMATGALAGDVITVQIPQIDVSAVPAGGAVDLTLSATTGAGVVAIPVDSLAGTVIGLVANGPIVQLTPELTATFTPVVDTLTVASGFTLHGSGVPAAAPGTGSTPGSNIHLQSATNGATAATIVGGAGAVPTLATDTAVVTLTVTPATSMAGIVSIAGTNITASSATGALPAAAAPGFFLLNAGGTATALLANGAGTWPGVATLPAAAPAAGSAEIALTTTINGVTVFPAVTTITASVAPQAANALVLPAAPSSSVFATPLAALASAGPVYTITRGAGASFVLNRVGAASTLKITDASGASAPNAAITYIARSATGAVLPLIGPPLPATLPTAGSSTVILGSAVVAAYGVQPAVLIVNVASTNALVTHRQATPAGMTISAGSGGVASQNPAAAVVGL